MTSVELSRDLSVARVYFSLLDPGVLWLPLMLASLPLLVIFIMCLALLQLFRYLGNPTEN